MHPSKPVYRILRGQAGLLDSLVGRAERLARIDAQFRELLGAPASDHCGVANLYRDTLVVFAETPAWAARLRYLGPSLLRQLLAANPTLKTLTRISVKVSPRAEPVQVSHPPRQLTPEAADLIASAATATEDPALRDALVRLASRASPRG